MDGIEKLLQSTATVLWPLIALLLIVLFRPAVSAIVESAKSRKFTIRIGGQELTMEEASADQRKLIADLQNQVSEIRNRLDGQSETEHENLAKTEIQEPIPSSVSKQPKIPSVLWVDDHPKNNSYFIEQLRNSGIQVDLALSTSTAIEKLSNRDYSCIISDMGRLEGSTYNPSAGIDLLVVVRNKSKSSPPFIIYSSSQAREKYGQVAYNHGATAVTSSPTELFGLLRQTIPF